MDILAFDTCFGAISVALRRRCASGEWQIQSSYEPRITGHAERLFPMIAEVAGDVPKVLSSVDRVAVTLGPGTFTGVRVGIAAARGFALATGKTVVGVTSLAVMAHSAAASLGSERAQRQLAVAVDARRDMIYFQVFDDQLATTGEILLVSAERAADLLQKQPAVVVGSGATAVVHAAGGETEARFPDLQPDARTLAMMAPELPPLDAVKPLYIREPDAKPQDDKSVHRIAP